MVEPGTRKDPTRRAVWSITAALSLCLLFAGFVYQPEPEPDVLVSGAHFLLKMGMLDEAKRDLLRALDQEPEHPAAHMLLAYVAERQGDAGAALVHYEAAEPLIVADGDLSAAAGFLVSRGLLRLAAGDFEGAAADAERLIAGEHRRGAGFAIRAFSRLGRRDDTGFREDLARARAVDPGDPVFRLRRESITETIPWAAAFF